jgi:hypothetical protein
MAQFVGQSLGFGGGSVDEEKVEVVIECELEGGGASGTTGAEHEDFFSVELEAELLAETTDKGIGVGVEAVGADFGRRVVNFGEGTPLAARVFGFEADGIDCAPAASGVVEGVDEVEGEEFVWDGEVKSDEAHGFGAVDGGAEFIGGDVEREVTPIEFEGRESGVVHGGGGGVFNGVSIDGAETRGSIDGRGWRLGRHAGGYSNKVQSSKFKVQSPGPTNDTNFTNDGMTKGRDKHGWTRKRMNIVSRIHGQEP